MRPTRWEDCDREDLSNIPKMIANGFTIIFNSRDKAHKRTTIDNIPHYPVSFERDNILIWERILGVGSVLRPGCWKMHIDEPRSEIQVFDNIDEILSHLEVKHPTNTHKC